MTHTLRTTLPGPAPLSPSRPGGAGNATGVQPAQNLTVTSPNAAPLAPDQPQGWQTQTDTSRRLTARVDTFASEMFGSGAISEEVNLWLACNELERFLESCPPESYQDVRFALGMLEKQRDLYKLLFDNTHALLSA